MGLVAALICLFFPIAQPLVIGYIAVCGLSAGVGGLLAFICALNIGAVACVFLLQMDWFGYVSLLLTIILPGLIIYFGMKRRAAYQNIVALGGGVFTLTSYFCMGLPYMLKGESAIKWVYDGLEQYVAMLGSGTVQGITESALIKRMVTMFNEIMPIVPGIIFGAFIIVGMAAMFLAVLFAKKLAQKQNAQNIRHMRPMIFWQLPGTFTALALVLVIGSIIISFSQRVNSEIIAITVFCMLFPPLLVQGISFIGFFALTAERSSASIFMMVAPLFFAIVYPPFLFAYAIFGILEQVLHIRQKIILAKLMQQKTVNFRRQQAEYYQEIERIREKINKENNDDSGDNKKDE